jgi:hypothetical protein
MIKLRMPIEVVWLKAKIKRKFIAIRADKALFKKNLDNLYSIKHTLNVITAPSRTTV